MAEKDLKAMYRTRTEGDFPAEFEVLGRKMVKVEDLRYGTNPHQPAAFYRPAEGDKLVLGAYEILKTGKSGLSQTNIEDMHHAVGILKYMPRPACAVMKHCNPSGAAIRVNDPPQNLAAHIGHHLISRHEVVLGAGTDGPDIDVGAEDIRPRTHSDGGDLDVVADEIAKAS